MDTDEIFKEKYKKYKLRVKLWEKEFKLKHGRVPSKYDIRDASKEIRDSYKMYYKLKTSYLEDTLNEALNDDGFDVLEISQANTETSDSFSIVDELGASFNGGPALPLDISSIVGVGNNNPTTAAAGSAESVNNLNQAAPPNILGNVANYSENRPLRKFEATESLKSNEEAWGASVSKNLKDDKPLENVVGKINKLRNSLDLKTNLQKKLFKSAEMSATLKVPKRNPRKALSRNPSKIDEDAMKNFENTENMQGLMEKQKSEILPDLETILTQKAKEQQAMASEVNSSTVNKINEPPSSKLEAQTKPMTNVPISKLMGEQTLKTHVDKGWLERNASGPVSKKSLEQTTDTHHAVTSTESFGLSNLTLSNVKTKFVKAQIEDDKVHSNLDSINHQSPPKHSASPLANNSAIKALRSDSDSFVSGSDDDDRKATEFRQRIKRRRLLPTVSETATSSNSTEKPLEPIESADFSADDSREDPDFVVETEKSSERKLRRNTKQTNTKDDVNGIDPEDENMTKKIGSQSKKPTKKRTTTAKANSESTVKKSKAMISEKSAPKVGRRTKSSRSAKSDVDNASQPAAQESEEPPDSEDLKSTLLLERSSLVSTPRIPEKDLELANNVATRYINTVTTTQTNSVAKALPIDEKRAEARRKLEEKIASGRLNENFVRINLERKVYVRGKRTINYSKYKKKLWRSKKREAAALCGPDMDMRGCDGGVLKCFECGQVGHFASDCKIKSDSLLPLTAELAEDPSPFPTLEEAATMASQNVVIVHGSNLSKMPQASNPALYATTASSDKELSANAENECIAEESDMEEDENCVEKFFEDDNDALIDLDINKLAAMERSKNYVGHKIPEDFLKKAGLDKCDLSSNTAIHDSKAVVGALYDLNPDGTVKDVTPEVMEALRMFGHVNFRKGQDRAVMRILSGLSTLVTLSTGSGKSLCYQLPAYLFSHLKRSITLVISPLVSLMEDQVTGVPHFLRAHCLHTNQTPQQKQKVLDMIRDGQVDVLLVSPEAVVSGERSTGFGAILRQLPPIAFACIDEVHCVSQWSHNFRPSYLMICKVLRENLGVSTVLGLTATATYPTRQSIIEHLGIRDGESGIISDIPLPDNLVLSVSKDDNRDAALLELLHSSRFENCQSIIIYCTRRDECERVSGFLRTYLKDYQQRPSVEGVKKTKRKRVNWQAEPYHAGLPSSRRRTIQNAFMRNELRIVVATIAFGMGINKPDIRAIIHYNMPRNFESYVQEIGRAGRDGKISHCHAFLDPKGSDRFELRRHIFANSLDRYVIRKLLQNIFVPCSCRKSTENQSSDAKPSTRSCPGHEIGFSIENTVQALDIPEENISTLLCYLELEKSYHIEVLSTAYIKAKVISYGGPKYLKHAAKESPPLAMAIAMEIKRNTFKEDANVIEFSVIDVAAAMGWNSGVVKYQLKGLEWIQVKGLPRRSPITVSFFDLGFRIKAPGDFTDEETDNALDMLYNRAVQQERTQLIQLQYVFQSLSSTAFSSFLKCSELDAVTTRSDQLKGIIRDYFQNDYPKDIQLETEFSTITDECIIQDILSLIYMYPENNFSGRTIARIFHGIQSPNYPAAIWGRCKYWRTYLKTDFNRILKLANQIIVQNRI